MAGPLRADRVKQTSTTTGTGTLNLSATIPTGAISFVSGIGSGNTVHYCIEHQTADEWEIGVGTVTSGSPDTLSRTTIIASSNSGSAVSFSSGTKNVFCVAPAEYGMPLIKITTTHAIQLWKQTAGSQTAGNARGNFAVDLQGARNNAAQVASGYYSVICGGIKNKATNSRSTICGGDTNTVTGAFSFIGAGSGNSVTTSRAVIVGGGQNTAGANYAFLGGGYGNTSSGAYSVVGGGISNNVNSAKATIAGGANNASSAGGSTVGGGLNNTASGYVSCVPGGQRGIADKYGQWAHAAGMFNAGGDAQTSEFVLRISTTNGTQTEMFLNGSNARMTLSNDTTWAFSALVVARRTDANDESAAYLLQGAVDRNASAGTTAIVGSVTKTVIAEDNAAWDVDIDADTTNGSLRIRVTGEAAKNIQWVAFVRTVETTG